MCVMKTSKNIFAIILFAVVCSFKAFADADSGAEKTVSVTLNQLGYKPSASKVAIVSITEAESSSKELTVFQIVDTKINKIVFEGELSKPQKWPYSGETVRQADFSELKKNGVYVLTLGDSIKSLPFEVTQAPLYEVHKAAIKAFYFNRSGTSISAKLGGQHAREAGHPDISVKVHKSAASKSRPEGTLLSLPKGWYDAGDYGKYAVNSGISTYTLLAAYQHYTNLYRDLNLNIPESGDAVPDLIDEIKWNLDWLELMQDTDGGVYHKHTALQFSDIDLAPKNDQAQRYVIGKSVTASLDFAAVMAVASRVMRGFEKQFPGASKRYREKALKAYEWASANPDALYIQPKDVGTGAYDDDDANDEFAWAEAELFLLTGDKHYFDEFVARKASPSSNLTWSDVSALGFISLASSGEKFLSNQQYSAIRDDLIAAANVHYLIYQNSAYGVPASEPDFVWGSNGGVLNNGIILIQGYRLTGDEKYLRAAMSTVDYVLGKNPTGFSYVTGHGVKTPVNIHHRPSVADKTSAPVPGFVAGGPHTGKQDGCEYSGHYPATTYADTVCSYSTNEVAINWNAPLVYMLGAANSK